MIKYIPEHLFSHTKHCVGLYEGATSFSAFKKKLIKLSHTLPENEPLEYGRKRDPQENINKILGDGFESFCELFVMLLGYHRHVGLSDYQPIEASKDEGIDAYAKNIENQRSAVQCKFVSDPTYEFTANGSNLGNFLIEASFEGIEYQNKEVKRLFLFTTAKGIHYHTEEKWRSSIKVFNNAFLKQMTDRNPLFWNKCTEILKEQQKDGRL